MMDERLLVLFCGCLGLAAINAAELTPTSYEEHETAIANPPAQPSPASIVSGQLARATLGPSLSTIVARPLFSPSRRPLEKEAPVSEDFNGKRLSGIIIAPEQRIAIFAVDGGKPLALGEGETVGAWQIETIT